MLATPIREPIKVENIEYMAGSFFIRLDKTVSTKLNNKLGQILIKNIGFPIKKELIHQVESEINQLFLQMFSAGSMYETEEEYILEEELPPRITINQIGQLEWKL